VPGGLTTAKIVGETANITRFRSEACFAMHAGVGPARITCHAVRTRRPSTATAVAACRGMLTFVGR